MRGTRVIASYNCNLLCGCCEYKCAPFKHGSMKVDKFKENVINSIKSGYGDYIKIDGGEPFLYAATIYKYLKAIFDIKSKKIITTNGFWGSSDPYLDIIMDFKAIGLEEIVFEYDYFHSCYIDIAIIKRAMEMVKKCELKISMKAYMNTSNLSDLNDKKTFEFVRELKQAHGNMVIAFKVINAPKASTREKVILL